MKRLPDDFEHPRESIMKRLPKGFWKVMEVAILLGIVLVLVLGGVI